jgi:hypothetical protein
MRRVPLSLLLLVLVLPARAQERQKLAQTTMKFLSVSVDARAAALGDAVTAVDGMASSLFYNPAGMARQQQRMQLGAAQTKFIADIDHAAAAATFAPARGRFGVLGVSLQTVDYGEQIETVRANNAQGYDELGTFTPTAFAAGVGYAKALTDRFSVGAHVKYATMDLGDPLRSRSGADGSLVFDEAREGTLAYDFGLLYRTDFHGLNFAVAARNFAPQVSFAREDNRLPLTLRIGVSLDAASLAGLNTSTHSLQLAFDNNLQQDYLEQIRFGVEYGFLNTLFLRAGYTRPTDQQGVSLGFGLQRSLYGVGIGLDYAYTDYGEFNQFGRVQRAALRFSF